ncbi:hypothetical protein RF11_09333 [Thelohanellus kitauei]|uniref:Uncharacterized protein n=1 Tax=Thelohanellus kitauei TaxID=669202 RepID=A0A0C2MYM7_THEKT|nr:hypothetical protein RF11_09333 [Thelohanellus kitauei]
MNSDQLRDLVRDVDVRCQTNLKDLSIVVITFLGALYAVKPTFPNLLRKSGYFTSFLGMYSRNYGYFFRDSIDGDMHPISPGGSGSSRIPRYRLADVPKPWIKVK